MQTREIKTVGELLDVLGEWKDRQAIFRGVFSSEYSLKTSIGRCPVPEDTTRAEMERRLFRRFKDRSLPHLTFTPRDDWEWLAVAQHFGLPTRLLDWSSNPLVAAYFAVEREGDVAPSLSLTACTKFRTL